MSWLAEELNEKGHYVGLIYSLEHNLNLHVKITQCQCLVEYFYIAIALQENDTPEKSNKYILKGRKLLNLLNERRHRVLSHNGR